MAPDTSTEAIWNPRKVLNLRDSGGVFPCVGVAKSKMNSPRCRLVIQTRELNSAARTLHEMSRHNPSEVSTAQLRKLARDLLCKEYHQSSQVQEVVEQWGIRIREFEVEFGERVRVGEELRAVRRELEGAKRECDGVRRRCDGVTVERDRLRAELNGLKRDSVRVQPRGESQEISREHDRTSVAGENFSLKWQLAESAMVIQKLEREKEQNLEQITSLTERLVRSTCKILELGETEKSGSAEIQRLRKVVENKTDELVEAEKFQSWEIDELKKCVLDSDAKFEESAATSKAEIDKLNEQLWNTQAELEENQRAWDRDADGLRRRLDDKDSNIKELEAEISKSRTHFIQGLDNVNQALRDSRTEYRRRISHLEQRNQMLTGQKAVAAFRTSVKLLVMRKKYEHVESERQKLLGQEAKLSRRLEDADMRLATQDHILSQLRLQGVEKGFCAVIGTKPRRLCFRRLSKFGELMA